MKVVMGKFKMFVSCLMFEEVKVLKEGFFGGE